MLYNVVAKDRGLVNGDKQNFVVDPTTYPMPTAMWALPFLGRIAPQDNLDWRANQSRDGGMSPDWHMAG